MLKVVVIVIVYLVVVVWNAVQRESRKKTQQRQLRDLELDSQELEDAEALTPAEREKRRREIAEALSQALGDASPEELEEMLGEGEDQNEDEARTPLPSETPRRQPLTAEPVGESYAAPIPPPHTSPLEGVKTPALLHAEEHMGPTLEAGDFPVHPSEAALHADAHIATTPAVPTPHPSPQEPRHKPVTLEGLGLPRTAAGMRKAVIFSEILGRPRCLRPPRQDA
ncbi:MAG: hypothetical protein ACI4SG_06980 [Oligosphaeraceae bacterium]